MQDLPFTLQQRAPTTPTWDAPTESLEFIHPAALRAAVATPCMALACTLPCYQNAVSFFTQGSAVLPLCTGQMWAACTSPQAEISGDGSRLGCYFAEDRTGGNHTVILPQFARLSDKRWAHIQPLLIAFQMYLHSLWGVSLCQSRNLDHRSEELSVQLRVSSTNHHSHGNTLWVGNQ